MNGLRKDPQTLPLPFDVAAKIMQLTVMSFCATPFRPAPVGGAEIGDPVSQSAISGHCASFDKLSVRSECILP